MNKLVEIELRQGEVLREDERQSSGYIDQVMSASLNRLADLDRLRFWPDDKRELVSRMVEYMVLHGEQACRDWLPSDRFWGVYVVGSARHKPLRVVDLDLLSVGNMGEILDFNSSFRGLFPFGDFDVEREYMGDELPLEFLTGVVEQSSLTVYRSVVPGSDDDRRVKLKSVFFWEEDQSSGYPEDLSQFEASWDVDESGLALPRMPLIKMVISKATQQELTYPL